MEKMEFYTLDEVTDRFYGKKGTPKRDSHDKEFNKWLLGYTYDMHKEHPGILLAEELKAKGIKQKDFAEKIGMSASNFNSLLHGKRDINKDIADGLERELNIPASAWMKIQSEYNKSVKLKKDEEKNYSFATLQRSIDRLSDQIGQLIALHQSRNFSNIKI